MQGMPPAMQEPPAPEGLQLDAVLQQVSANLPEPLVEALKQIAAQIATLPPEEIQSFLETLDYLEQNKDRYQEAVQEMVAAGKIPPDSAPPQYDAALFSAIREVVSAAMSSAPMPAPQMPMEPPMGFARGGIAQLAKQGRFGDNMLARINPQQANMLRARGGAGTINPRTGLREYFNLWKTLAPIVGAVAGAFLPFGSVIGPAVGSFAASKLAGNSTKDALMGAALAGVVGYGAGNSMAATAGGYGGSAFSGGTGPSLGSALFTGASKEGVGSLFTAGTPSSVNTGGGITNAGKASSVTTDPNFPAYGTPASSQTASAGITLPKNITEYNALTAAQQTEVLPLLRQQAEAAKLLPAANQFGFLGDLGKTALANPLPTALILSSLASLDQEKKPKNVDTAYGGVTAADLIKKDPKSYLFDPRSFGITDAAALKEYDDAVSASTLSAKAGGPINGPGTGTSDSIPARLSDGEFVMTASAVRGAGGGDRKAGARKMYQMMHEFEKRA